MSFRKNRITRPILKWARGAMPSLSETEAEAVSSGDVHFEAELFSGKPDWSMLRDMTPAKLMKTSRRSSRGPAASSAG